MNVAATGASLPRRSLAGLVALLGWLVLAAAIATIAPATAQDQSSVILNLRGDETPEAIRKMVDALSAPGRQVEIRVGGLATAATPAPAPAVVPTPAAAKPSMADEDGFQAQINALIDQFIEGLDYGGTAIPSIIQLPDDWGQLWQRNLNGRSGPSAGWRTLAILCLALAIAFAFRLAGERWFARRRQPKGPEFTPRLIAAGWGLLQDVLTIFVALITVRAARNAWLPESDLAMFALTTGANGAVIGALYIAIGRFLLAPGAPERRIMPLPRAERHYRALIVYAVATPLAVTSILLAHRVGSGPLPATGLIALSSTALTLFKLWFFNDIRRDLAILILAGSAHPGPFRRLVAASAAWFYMGVMVVLWMVTCAAAMMRNGGRWAEAAALTEIAVVLIPILVVGVSSLLNCHAARRE
ncbi:MAG: hypothetical protein EOP23_20605, partial [Hyphomicrobiales bacterium]